MIRVVINGEVAYPDTSQKIKVTYENQFVKDSGSYTYEVQFPMAILENKKIFKNVDRFDVKKKLSDYEDCKLYVDNRLVISGKGTVTKIDNTKVCLQIVGVKSRIKYNAKFENHYIDEIDYPSVILDTGLDTDKYNSVGITEVSLDNKQWAIFIDLTKANFVGQKGVCVLSPVNDETNEIQANRVSVIKFNKIKVNGVKYPKGTYKLMSNCAVMPYVMYVLKKVMEFEGYSIIRNDIDKDPWNRLVIVSACKSGKVKNALPHWTVYKFIDEIRKFLNVSFVFDEVKKTVSIIETNELMSNEAVTYECEDEFSSEYDEDGLDNLSTSNIEYSFDSSANRDWREYISQSVQKNYSTKEYESVDKLVEAAEAMTEKERKTTIFKTGHNYYIWADLPKDGNPENEETENVRTQCGYFNPIIRDMDSDTFQELNIIPAAMFQVRNFGTKPTMWETLFDDMGNKWIVMPSVTNEKEQSLEDMTVDDDGEYYYSVQDAMQGSSEENTTETDDAKMPVAFVANNLVNLQSHAAVAYNETLSGEDKKYRIPVLFTDYRMYYQTVLKTERASLTLENLPYIQSFGNLKTKEDEGRFSNSSVDKNNQICIKFCTEDIPDPSSIYCFRGKKYICEKVEMEVSNDGISKEKNGYFYEIL